MEKENFDSKELQSDDIILTTINKYKEEDLLECYKILQKLFQNISENPYEKKYKIFKKSNPIIHLKVMKITEVLDVLKIIGYKEYDKDTLIWDETNINIITKMSEDLKMFINLIEGKLTNRKFAELAEKDPDKKAFLEEQRRLEHLKKEDEKRTKELMGIHMQETKSNWQQNVDSQAKELNFGAKECRFEPAKNRGGG
jgi:hypothetical protein